MKELSATEMGAAIVNMREDSRIYVGISEETARSVELLHMKKASMENLFTAYINKSTEQADQMNLNKFIDEYKDACMEQDRIIRKTLLEALGAEGYHEVMLPINRIVYLIDSISKTIVLCRDNGTLCGNGSCSIKGT